MEVHFEETTHKNIIDIPVNIIPFPVQRLRQHERYRYAEYPGGRNKFRRAG